MQEQVQGRRARHGCTRAFREVSISLQMDDHTPVAISDDPKSPLLPVQSSPRSPLSPFNTLFTANSLYILSGPLTCMLVYFFVDLDGRQPCSNMLAVLTWVFMWWLTGAIPLAVTSLSPLFLFPIFGIASADEVAKAYMDDIIALVLGSFILALAVEHYNIHRRLALTMTSVFCGEPVNPRMLLFGICSTTAFVSMWMHNTPTVMLLIPVATGILERFPEGEAVHHPDVRRFCKAVILGVVYSTLVGGMSTLVGSGVNVILAGMWESYFPDAKPITFSSWFLFGFPFALIMFFALWGILCVMYCSKGCEKTLAVYLDRAHLRRDLELLGPMDYAEKMILALFGLLVLLWMTRSLTSNVPGWGALFNGRVGDGTASVMIATLLFIIPNGKNKGEKLMDWNKCKKLHWNVILLIGGGFAIAEGVQTSGLAEMLTANLAFLETAPYLAIAPLACLVSSTVTEFTANDAATTLVLPLLVELAKSTKVHPLVLMVPGAMGAHFSFLLPTCTPSNLVGFTTGYFEVKDMIMTGIALKILGIGMIAVLMPTLGSLVFQTNGQA